ncbi:hypothetical protein ACWGB8_01085 [Kitasatospora sp. NPDC054939]
MLPESDSALPPAARRRPIVGELVRDLRADGYTTPLVVTEVGHGMATLRMHGVDAADGTAGKAARYFDELEPWC